MWPDIDKVPLFDSVPSAVQDLRRFRERLYASRFFGGHTPDYLSADREGDLKLSVLSWLVWATIVAMPGAAKGDSLYLDLEELGLAEHWQRSRQRTAVFADPLLAVLFELRNYEVHVELRSASIRPFVARLQERDGDIREVELHERAYLEPIVWDQLSRNRNIRSGRSQVSVEMIDWFNGQAAQWPAVYLIAVARERYYTLVDEFLSFTSGRGAG